MLDRRSWSPGDTRTAFTDTLTAAMIHIKPTEQSVPCVLLLVLCMHVHIHTHTRHKPHGTMSYYSLGSTYLHKQTYTGTIAVHTKHTVAECERHACAQTHI